MVGFRSNLYGSSCCFIFDNIIWCNKEIFKIVIVAGALLVLWIAYTTWSGEEVSIESAVDKATEAYEGGKESIEKVKDDFIDNIKEKKKID
ncbi:MAG: hypothetical protein CM1200mP1_15700 [Candidatus Neomarinimicrobiota bacterium]|nr:MAG: hypothetical protein CM1200mP1_15700 [Candidatus Neomarinimicrobiota bacterium]